MMDSSTTAAFVTAAVRSGESGLLSALIQKLWPNINEAVCKIVKESVEPTFKDLPSTLKTLHFTELDLGTAPITIDNIIVHDKEQNGKTLQFDMDLYWDGNCNIQLKADYIGNFGIQHLKFYGRLSVILSPLLDVMPIVSAAQVCFINKPKFELDFLGTANIADFTFISSKIRTIISDIINNMLVLPNRMYFKVDPANNFLDTYRPPIGIARITIINGTGFQGKTGLLTDAHDVYCLVNFGCNNTEWRTTTQKNSSTPEWNETHDYLLYDYDQVINIHAWDEDTGGADDDLGSSQVTIRELLYATGKQITLDLIGDITYKGGQKVTLSCQLCKLDITDHESLKKGDDYDDSNNNSENCISGFVTILIAGAKNIPIKKQEDAKTFVKVKHGDEEFVTKTVVKAAGVDPLNPVYDKAFEMPIRHKSSNNNSSIEILLMNGEDTVLGSKMISYDELTEVGTITMHDCSIVEGASTTLEFSISLFGVVAPADGETFLTEDEIARAYETTTTSSSSSQSNNKGIVRITVVKGWGFHVEKRTRRLLRRKDIPDIYCNITFGSSPKIWRTKTIRNSITPEWGENNEYTDYVLSDHGQIININVFDEDKHTDKDDDLGSARISIGKLLLHGTMDVELLESGKPTGQFISIKATMVSSS